MMKASLSKFKCILAVETSCDDTSVAIVAEDGQVIAVKTKNQDLQHKDFGGIVPEIAGRNHTENIIGLISEIMEETSKKWADIDGFAVTNRPGLVGSLMVGLISVKTLSMALKKPFIAVNHLEGHLLAPFLKDKEYCPPTDFDYPYVALAVSGGHSQIYQITNFGSYKVLGRSLDDAAGEAFDKFGKMLGLGFPGGIKVDQISQTGDPKKYKFPIGLEKTKDLNFSFSGLKSFAQRLIQSMDKELVKSETPSLCASYQEAIVDALLLKLNKAVEKMDSQRVVITGGVSANFRLRSRAEDWAKKKGLQLVLPPLRYCTDNAAMIGYVGINKLNRNIFSDFREGPSPRVYTEDFEN